MAAEASDFEKESRDPMIRRLVGLIEAEMKGRTETFCIQGEQLMVDEVAAHNGLLPLFCYKAASLCEEGMKKRLPLYFEHDKTALIEVIPMTEAGADNLFSLWAHFLHFSLEEEVRRLKRDRKLVNGMIPLDALYQDWHQAVRAGKFAVRPSSRPLPSMPSQGGQQG